MSSIKFSLHALKECERLKDHFLFSVVGKNVVSENTLAISILNISVIAIISKQIWVKSRKSSRSIFLKGNMHLCENGIVSVCNLVYLETEFHLHYITYSFWYYQKKFAFDQKKNH